jgi:hypothetical protein
LVIQALENPLPKRILIANFQLFSPNENPNPSTISLRLQDVVAVSSPKFLVDDIEKPSQGLPRILKNKQKPNQLRAAGQAPASRVWSIGAIPSAALLQCPAW